MSNPTPWGSWPWAGLNLRNEVAESRGHRSLAALERYLDQDAAREKAEVARNLLVGEVGKLTV